MNDALGYNFRMSIRCISLFLTLVLFVTFAVSSVAHAIPNSPALDFENPSPPPPEATESDDVAKKAAIDITEPPPPTFERSEAEYFYPYRHALSFRGGAVIDSGNGQAGPIGLMGVQYLFPISNPLRQIEIGADLLSSSNGSIHAAQRFIHSRARLRPYSKMGLGIKIVPSEQLTTFLKYQNFQIRGATGIERLVYKTTSLRAELELVAGTVGIQGIATLGYVWAW